MMTDDLLKTRYARHLDKLIELAEKELDRTRPEPHYHRLARMYCDRFQSLRHTWRCHDGDLAWAFRSLCDADRLEVITSTATHGFFPLYDLPMDDIRPRVHPRDTPSTPGSSTTRSPMTSSTTSGFYAPDVAAMLPAGEPS